MDNLYISPKFTKICYNNSGERVIIHGVFHQGRGIPQCSIQDNVTRKANILRSNGTDKATVLEYNSNYKNFIELSFYDLKPVYFISNECDSIRWTKKTRELYHREIGEK